MSTTIDNLLHEYRHFPPPDSFAPDAPAQAELYRAAAADRLGFWADQARELLTWSQDFTEVLDWTDPPFARWFGDGTLNVAANCVDRHVEAGLGDRVAIYFEGEPGDTRVITYADLHAEVMRAANMLADIGVGVGDRVAIYLPMIPEAVISMLACARLGAMHSVVFGGYSADSLRSRIDDAKAKVVITADGGWRKGAVLPLKSVVDEALSEHRGYAAQATVDRVVVVKRGGNELDWYVGRDVWWADAMRVADPVHVARPFPAEHPLFILYTSGTTGKPKGVVHTSAGYLVQAAFTHRHVFDLHPESDVYWCTADIGWITGHSYVVYGPLANGATQVMYEGTPDSPGPGRWWDIIEKYKVTQFYTAPTAIRSFMREGRQVPQAHDLSSLRLLGSVGEPINPEAWMWYRDVIGSGKCPIVDTWWQTETGGIMIAALPAVTTLKPGSAQVPIPGMEIDVLDEAGNSVGRDQGGLLSITAPWPGMLRGIWGDPERFVKQYWSRFPGRYFAGDGARRDRDGDLWLLGRVDDVLNVSGHRLSTAEIESALVEHPYTAEAAVVAAPDERTGQAVVAFVILKQSQQEAASSHDVPAELRTFVAERIGAIARPREVHVVGELPKTRSGKIMRRLLADLVADGEIGETSTLANAQIIRQIAEQLGVASKPSW